EKFPEGAWLVQLANLSVGAEVAEVESAIVSALGISDQSATGLREKLLSFLPDRKLLLVLDNCEHVVAAVRTTLPVILREAPESGVITRRGDDRGGGGEALGRVLAVDAPHQG